MIVCSIVLLVLLTACTKKEVVSEQVVASGDVVSVWYTGSLADNSVFDSNIKAVAQASGTYNPNRPYEPLTFTVGSGQMIPGFDKAVVGMKKGEKKTVSVPPEDAYGVKQEDLTRSLPTTQEIDRVIVMERFRNVPSAQFKTLFGSDPVKGKSYANTQVDWMYIVREIPGNVSPGSLIRVEADLKVGQKINLPNTKWNSTVTAINQSDITVRQDPIDNSVLETPFGDATIELTNEKIIVSIDAQIGAVIPGPQGNQVKIVDVKDGQMKLDLNHPLAGETLTFNIEIANVTKSLIK